MFIDYLIFILAILVVILSAFYKPTTFIAKFISLLAVMVGTSLLVSLALNLVPGDPIDHILGDQAQSYSRHNLALQLGLINEQGEKLNFVNQYANFITSLMQNKLTSFITQRPTLTVMFERLPYSIFLAIAAIIVASLIGPLFGIIAALYQRKWPDYLLSLFALIGISVPSFILAPMLLLVLSIKFKIFPISGADDGFISVALPSISLGTALAAMLARMSRASMLEVLSQDYVRTAMAKGLNNKNVFFKHALKNALIPVITLMGLQFGAVLAGTVVTEKIFNWPGIGLLLFESIQKLDLPMVQTCVLFIAFFYATINMITDLLYSLIDPRISIGSSK